MSRRGGIITALVFYGSLVLYFVYENKEYTPIETFEGFMRTYLYSVQKILLNVNLVITIFAYYTKVPILVAEYKVRYAQDLTKRLLLSMMGRSCCISGATLLFFGAAGATFPADPAGFGILIKSVLLVFLYVFCWSAAEKLIYVQTGNLVLGIVVCPLASLMISIIHSNLIFNNVIGKGMTMFAAVMGVMTALCLLLLLRTIRRSQCLI